MIDFQKRKGGTGSGGGVGREWDGRRIFNRRAGRPGGLPYIAMAGNFFHLPHPHPHADHPIDFSGLHSPEVQKIKSSKLEYPGGGF